MKHRLTQLRQFLFTIVGVLACGAMYAQTVSGTVTSSRDGGALTGATVLVKGTTTGAFTDDEGKFTVAAGDADVLIVSYIGHGRLEVPVEGRSSINITLQATESTLEEVIVTGYGTQKAKEVTSAISSVKAEDFNQGNVNDPTQLLQGKVAGLSIARPGGNPNGGFNIRLRGLSTAGANTQPLIIIDGVPGASLQTVDPNDIASIDVLKDGSAAAIYGTRGASGVIIVTTKRGLEGTSQVSYNGYASSESVDRLVPVLDAAGYKAFGGGTDLGSETDWFDELTRNAFSHVHNLSVSGGSAKTTYRVSANYRDIDGIAIGTGFEQINGRVNVQQKAIDDRLTLTFDMTSTVRNSRFGFDEAFRYATIYNPTAPVTNSDAAFDQYDGYFQQVLFDYYNPVAILEQNRNEGNLKRQLASLRGNFEIIDGLNIGAFYSRQTENDIQGQYWDRNSFWVGADRNGRASRFTNERTFDLFEATATYKNSFDAFNLDVLAGYSFQEFLNEGFGADGGDFLTDAFQFDNLGGASDFPNGLGSVFSYKNTERLIAFFGRVNLNYDDTYYLSASLRREGSSRFGENNKWGVFPGVSAGITLSNLFTLPGMDNLKLRGGFGQTGNRPGESYLSLLRLSPVGNFFFNGEFVSSFGPTRNANPNLKWETKSDINIGLDFSFLEYRLNGSLDFYTTTTSDLILDFAVPQPPNLAGTTFLNVGELNNSGIELTLDYDIIQNDNFNWEIAIATNYFLSANLVSLSNDEVSFGGFRLTSNLGSPGQNNTPLVRIEEGGPIGQLWGLTYEGVDDAGQWIFKDLNEDGIINDEDESVIGNGLPKFQLGITNSFTFGNFDFNFFLRGVFGHDMVNTYRAFYEAPVAIQSYNILETSENVKTLTASPKFSSYHVERADFMKLDNASLGYTFQTPEDGPFSKIRLYVTGQNLITVTNYLGADPEVRFDDGGNPLAPGIDRRNTYFTTRTITIGANLGF